MMDPKELFGLACMVGAVIGWAMWWREIRNAPQEVPDGDED